MVPRIIGGLFTFAAMLVFSTSKYLPNNGGNSFSRGTPGFVFNCSGKEDGNYPHPTKCTHYVACVGKAIAYEMVCALNHDLMPLHYVADSGPEPVKSRCDYPEIAKCTIAGAVSGSGQAGGAQIGGGQSGGGQSGGGQSGGRPTGGRPTGGSQSGGGHSGGGQNGGGQTGGGQSGGGQSGGGQSGGGQSGGRPTGGAQSGSGQSGGAQSGSGQSGGAQSGGAQSGGAQSGGAQSGGAQSGIGQSGGGQTSGKPGSFQPTKGPSQSQTQSSSQGQGPSQVTTKAPAYAPAQSLVTTRKPGKNPSHTFDPTDCTRDDECKLKGYCRKYHSFNKDLKKWEDHDCGQDLFWNEKANHGLIHGGNCDFFLNLEPVVQEKYKDDRDCIPPCEWWQTESQECTGKYNYRIPFNNVTLLGRESVLECPKSGGGEALVWSSSSKTCERCADAKDLKGNTCRKC